VTADFATQLLGQTLFMAVIIAGPVLLITMGVGLLISLFQVITQLQEMTLTFVPKLIAVVAALVLLGPWMLKKLLGFASVLIGNIPTYFG
jgi:flagellar biosynthesis protein FliQ